MVSLSAILEHLWFVVVLRCFIVLLVAWTAVVARTTVIATWASVVVTTWTTVVSAVVIATWASVSAWFALWLYITLRLLDERSA